MCRHCGHRRRHHRHHHGRHQFDGGFLRNYIHALTHDHHDPYHHHGFHHHGEPENPEDYEGDRVMFYSGGPTGFKVLIDRYRHSSVRVHVLESRYDYTDHGLSKVVPYRDVHIFITRDDLHRIIPRLHNGIYGFVIVDNDRTYMVRKWLKKEHEKGVSHGNLESHGLVESHGVVQDTLEDYAPNDVLYFRGSSSMFNRLMNRNRGRRTIIHILKDDEDYPFNKREVKGTSYRPDLHVWVHEDEFKRYLEHRNSLWLGVMIMEGDHRMTFGEYLKYSRKNKSPMKHHGDPCATAE